jgi:hypothetical protein
VVGDAEDVEAARAVQVDQLGKRKVAVAPGGVSVELAEERASAHRLSSSSARLAAILAPVR